MLSVHRPCGERQCAHRTKPGAHLVRPIAPGRALQCYAGDAAKLVVCVFEHIGQRLAQGLGLLRKHQPELSQQAADSNDAGGALGLESLAQAMHAQQALLLYGLDGNKVHVVSACGLAGIEVVDRSVVWDDGSIPAAFRGVFPQ